MQEKRTSAQHFDLAPCFNAFARRGRVPDVEPIRTILLVGARLTENGLNPRDRAILRSTVAYLLKTGIPVSEDFNARVVNLEYGDDFLEGKQKADMAVFSYVFDTNRASWKNVCWQERRLSGEDPDFLSLSPKHFVPWAWDRAAVNSDARIVASFGLFPTETTIGKLSLKHWFKAVRPRTIRREDEIPETRDMIEKNLCRNDALGPQAQFAFAVRRGAYLEALAGQVGEETLLGRRIRGDGARAPGLLERLADNFALG